MSLFLVSLLYLSGAVFLAGMGWRWFTWLRTPVPLNIVLTPGPVTTLGVLRRLADEALLFRSLFRANHWFGTAAWLFHFALLLLAVGHVGGLVAPGFARSLLRLTEPQFHHLAQVAGGLLGVLAVVPVLGLLLRRLLSQQMRFISTWSDYFVLVLFLLILGTGIQMRFRSDFDVAQAHRFVAGFLALQPVAPPSSPAFAAHLLLVCLLLVYIPFSKLLHLGGFTLNPVLNQKNNPREERFA